MAVDEYRYFVAVYHCRSFSSAARKMNITSQGIGKSIKSLEAQLGVKLFFRTPQGVEPTDIAAELYPSFCNILAEEERIEKIIEAARRPASVQTLIGRDSRLGDAIGIGVEEYCESHGVHIELLLTRDSEDDQAQQFVDNGYDYRFLSVELDTLPLLPRAPLCVLHYLPVVNAECGIAHKGEISIDDLRGRTILTTNTNNTPMRLLARMCREHGFTPKFRAIEKTYIWDVLSKPSEDVTFIRTNEAMEYPWISGLYAKLTMTPPLDTQIVLQTSHDRLDEDLVRCIRDSLLVRQFD